MKFSFLLLFFTLLFVPKTATSQSLNNYKYVIVPTQYGFLDEADKYKLNSLTEFLFEKYGFTAILEGEEYPEDLLGNRCTALTADVKSDSSKLFSFVTKVVVVLKNCNGQVVFKSKEGKSRLKKYKFAYQEALRDAFSSVKELNYAYSGSTETTEADNSDTVVMKEENTVEKTNQLSEGANPVFEYEGHAYVIEKNESALVLKRQGVEVPVALLNETSKGNYIYRSNETIGTAYFDEQGNLVVEYFDAGEIQKMVYALKKVIARSDDTKMEIFID